MAGCGGAGFCLCVAEGFSSSGDAIHQLSSVKERQCGDANWGVGLLTNMLYLYLSNAGAGYLGNSKRLRKQPSRSSWDMLIEPNHLQQSHASCSNPDLSSCTLGGVSTPFNAVDCFLLPGLPLRLRFQLSLLRRTTSLIA